MKKLLIIIVCTVLGAVAANPLTSFFSRVTWQRLNNFPLPVEKLLAVKPFGNEIWILASDNQTYKISYPCVSEQSCYERSNEIPDLPEGYSVDHGVGEYIDYFVMDGECGLRYDLVDVFPGKIKTCITFLARAEVFYTVAVVLNEEKELWIWDSPWISPYTYMGNYIGILCSGAVVGFWVGMFVMSRKDCTKFFGWIKYKKRL
ncbi:MAG: hypothetical protein Q8L87_13795 [Anaerolineales bacterium]|nr:hypothetical protein [Anaerolineales bacterium]